MKKLLLVACLISMHVVRADQEQNKDFQFLNLVHTKNSLDLVEQELHEANDADLTAIAVNLDAFIQSIANATVDITALSEIAKQLKSGQMVAREHIIKHVYEVLKQCLLEDAPFLRAPRLNAPHITSPVEPVGGCACDMDTLLRFLAAIRAKEDAILNELSQVAECCESLSTGSLVFTSTAILELLGTLTECCDEVYITVTTILVNLETLTTVIETLTTVVPTLTSIVPTLTNLNSTLTTILATDTTILSLVGTLTQCCDDTFDTVTTILKTDTTILALVGSLTECCDDVYNTSTTILNIVSNLSCVDTRTTLTTILATDTTILSLVGTLTQCCDDVYITVTTILVNLETVTTAIETLTTVVPTLTSIVPTLTNLNSTLTTILATTTTTLNLVGTLTECCDDVYNTSTTILALVGTLTECCCDDCEDIRIYQSSVGTGNTGYLISTSGVYQLSENIRYSPASGSSRAIRISASNVTLDLHCFRLEQANTATNVNGIVIDPSLTNVAIKNGESVFNFSRTGISTGTGCSFITIDNVTTLSCGVRGIELFSARNSQINYSTVQACCQNPAVGDVGILLDTCTQVTISNCLLNANGSILHQLSLIQSLTCSQCDIRDVAITNNIAGIATNTGSIFAGIDFRSTASCAIENCTIEHNNTSAPSAYGISLLTSTTNYINNSTIRDNIQTATYGRFDGVSLRSSPNNVLSKVTALHNSALGSNITGFTTSSSNNTSFLQCIAIGNRATASTSTSATGLSNISSTTCLVYQCVFAYQSCPAGTASGASIGTALLWTIIDSEFHNNLGSSSATSFGATSLGLNFVSRCRAYQNGTFSLNQLSGIAAGSVLSASTATVATASGPWGNIRVIT